MRISKRKQKKKSHDKERSPKMPEGNTPTGSNKQYCEERIILDYRERERKVRFSQVENVIYIHIGTDFKIFEFLLEKFDIINYFHLLFSQFLLIHAL